MVGDWCEVLANVSFITAVNACYLCLFCCACSFQFDAPDATKLAGSCLP